MSNMNVLTGGTPEQHAAFAAAAKKAGHTTVHILKKTTKKGGKKVVKKLTAKHGSMFGAPVKAGKKTVVKAKAPSAVPMGPGADEDDEEY